MTKDELTALGRDCYAAFNAVPPVSSSPAWGLWAEMCARVHIRAGAWIRSRLIEQDSMPRNFGKAVAALYREWQAEHGQGPAGRSCCPECDPRIPGYFYGWKKENGYVHSFICRCLCNDDPSLGPMPRMSREYAAAQGISALPVDYQGGPARFEREVFGLACAFGPSGFGMEARRLARSPEFDGGMRPAHARELADAAL